MLNCGCCGSLYTDFDTDYNFRYFRLQKLNDSLKQAEKKCVQLQAANEKLEPLRNHCPAIFRLLLQLGKEQVLCI